MITVTGTENFLMAATLAEGETVLENAAQEPEVSDLAELLIAMGAQIEGHGSSRIRIQGVPRLHGAEHAVVADRIEAGTFLCAVAACGGAVHLRHARAEHLEAVIEKLREAGVSVQASADGLRVQSPGAALLRAQSFRTTEYPGFPTDMQAQFMALNAVAQGSSSVSETIFENRFMHVHELQRLVRAQSFRTTEYPGFPTDMQAQFMALNAVAQGSSSVSETIFENRFMHVHELQRLGAKIRIDGRLALVEGLATPGGAAGRLSGATVMATDLRASASLVIAGLVAEGETVVDRIYHLDRGYDQMELKLRALGAQIERIA